jgi:hypothetical protein
MTLLCFFLIMMTDGVPVLALLIAMGCDTAIIITLALLGIIHA